MSIAQRILNEVFPFLAFKKDLMFSKKIIIVIKILFNLWIMLWIFVYFVPPLFFKHEIVYKNVHLYTNKTSNLAAYKTILKSTRGHIASNSLFDSSKQIEILYIDTEWLYKLLNPLDLVIAPSYASTYGNHVVIHELNPDEGYAFRFPQDSHKELIEAIIAHESTHVMQYSKYGYVSMLLIPEWIVEGYAELAEEGKSIRFTKSNFIKILQKDIKALHISDKYILWGFMVKHAIEKMHISVDDLHLGKVSYDEVYESLLKEYNIT